MSTLKKYVQNVCLIKIVQLSRSCVNISSLYITNKMYIYSLKSPRSYYIDVPSYKEMVLIN